MSTEQAREEIGRRLAKVRSRIRRAQWARGGLLVATVLLGGLLFMMAVDHFLAPLPSGIRWGMFGVWLLSVGFAIFVAAKPLLRKISLVQVARWIEGRHPEIEERMSTVMELTGEHAGASAGLIEELSRAAGEDVGKVDAKVEMKSVRSGRGWSKAAAALAILLMALLIIWPNQTARLAARAVAPFSDLGNADAMKFTVEPGDVELIDGDAISIQVTYDGAAKQLDLEMDFDSGNQISQAMSGSGHDWSYRMEPVRESFRYRARAGRGESDSFQVTVWPLPEVMDPRVELGFPEYTGLPKTNQALGPGIEALRGTRVKLTGTLNTAVETAWLEIDGKRLVEAAVETSASGGRVGFEWVLDDASSGHAVVMLKHRLGREIDALRFPVRVLDDQIPVVKWLSPIARELRIRPEELLQLKYEVTDDFGLELLQIEVKAGSKEPLRLYRDLPEKVTGGAELKRYRGQSEVAVGEMLENFSGVSQFRLRIRTEDGRPEDLDGPGVGVSEWLLVKIDNHAESLARQELRAEHEEARETIEQAIRATREARERMDWHRGEMKNEELSKDAVKHFAEAREKLAETKENLEKLSERMEESVHASKSDEVREASEMVEKAQQDLSSAPLQDGKEQREEKIDSARNEAEAAVKKLEAVRNEMDRERQRIEELARLLELTQRQQELARQAQQMANNPETEKQIPQDWKDKQRAMEEALRQQLREQPQARAEMLEKQADEARALAEEAKDLSKAQTGLQEQVSTQSESTETPESLTEALREELAKEQQKIAEETAQELSDARQERSASADVLPQAAAATEQASKALSEGEDQAAADSAKQAVEALEEAAAASGSDESQNGSGEEQAGKDAVEALAERQEKVAEALGALAEGRAEEALKGLQELQAEAAADLAQAISEVPQVEGSGPMNEARDASRTGGEQAKAAAESGKQGEAQASAAQHGEAAGNLQRSADALSRAADEFAQAAEQARGQQADPNRAPVSSDDLADAFEAASKASQQDLSAQAASQADKAAAAMARAAQAARQSMQGKPGPPGSPGPPGTPGSAPGNDPDEGARPAQASPGVPPELAKLGISAADWEKIQSSLKSDVGAAGGAGVPEEYRALVKDYFEAMTAE